MMWIIWWIILYIYIIYVYIYIYIVYIYIVYIYILVGGFNHLEKYENQWEGLSHILWKIKHV